MTTSRYGYQRVDVTGSLRPAWATQDLVSRKRTDRQLRARVGKDADMGTLHTANATAKRSDFGKQFGRA